MSKFIFEETGIRDMFVVYPTVFGDNRGYFMETYNEALFDEEGHVVRFVQDNQSMSRRGVLRGLHMQVKSPQGKLVRVISGEVFDVGVDMRKGSETFGEWFGTVLSAEKKNQLFIPEGFAHGFLVMSETAEFVYKCTRLYDPGDELGIRFDDGDIGIKWPDLGVPFILSDKDRAQPSFKQVKDVLGF